MKPLVRLNQNRNQLCPVLPPKHEKLTKRSRDGTNAASCFLAKDMIPMSTVEKEAVKKLIKEPAGTSSQAENVFSRPLCPSFTKGAVGSWEVS